MLNLEHSELPFQSLNFRVSIQMCEGLLLSEPVPRKSFKVRMPFDPLFLLISSSP